MDVYHHISHLGLSDLFEVPPLGLLDKVFAVGACVVLVVEGAHRVDTCLDGSARKGHE